MSDEALRRHLDRLWAYALAAVFFALAGAIVLLAYPKLLDAIDARAYKSTVGAHHCGELRRMLNNGETSTPEMDRVTLASYCNTNEWQEKP